MKRIHSVIIMCVAVVVCGADTAHAQWTFNGVKLFYNAGNVGIGTNNPAHKLDVRSAGSRAVFGWALAAAGTADGVYGLSHSASGRGVVGYVDAATGFNYGVYGRANSTKGRGVFGYAAATSGVNMGVYGKTNSANGYAGYFDGNVGVNGWIGTKADEPVDIYSNNERVFRVQWASDGAAQQISPNVIGGHQSNSVAAGVYGATIAGGGLNIQATEFPNLVLGNFGAIGGGIANIAGGANSTVGGGSQNTASGSGSTVGGGVNNIASGGSSTVPGGQSNTAAGSDSFAAGSSAKANHAGSFVWGDSLNADITSSANNQMTFRSVGGVRIFTNAALTAGVTLAAGGSAWAAVSDRNQKENVQPIDARKLLDRLAAIPITTWNYKSQDKSIRHIGPMAQDFAAAFGVGEDDKHITTIDADGVALAAIQGLHHIVQDKDAEIAELRARLQRLEAAMQEMTAAMKSFNDHQGGNP